MTTVQYIKKSMTVSDNTIATEGLLGEFLESLVKKGLNASKNTAKMF